MTHNDSQNGRPRRRGQRRRRLINIKRVAKMADVSVRTVRRWRSDADFPTAVTIPGKRYLRWYKGRDCRVAAKASAATAS